MRNLPRLMSSNILQAEKWKSEVKSLHKSFPKPTHSYRFDAFQLKRVLRMRAHSQPTIRLKLIL